MHSGREKKTKPTKRVQQVDYPAAEEHSNGKHEKVKKGGKHKYDHYENEDESSGAVDDGSSSQRRGGRWLPPGAVSVASVGPDLFIGWEELLSSREALKRRLDSISAVHGWEARAARKSFLGGVEPANLLQSIRDEVKTLEPAAEALDKADLLLELRTAREAVIALSEERHLLAEEMAEVMKKALRFVLITLPCHA